MTDARPLLALAVTAALVLGLSAAPQPAEAAPLPTIPVGDRPTSIAFAPVGNRAVVLNEGSRTASVIDVTTNSVQLVVPLSSIPRDVEITPDGEFAWVVGWEQGVMSAIQIITLDTGARTNVSVSFYRPMAIAFSSGGQLAWIVGPSGTIVLVDTATRAITGYISTDVPMDLNDIFMSKDGKYAYATGGDVSPGGWTTIDTATRQVVGNSGYGPRYGKGAITPDGTKILTPLTDNSIIFYGTTDTRHVTIPTGFGEEPAAVAITPVGSHAYVTNTSESSVTVVDVGHRSIVDSIPVGLEPRAIAVSPSGTKVYVANAGDDTVSVITRADRTVDTGIVQRVFGANRYETAVRISELGYAAGADELWIATGTNYPDALAAAAAAASANAPLLLVSPDAIPAVVADEIERLSPETIVVVGGLPSVGAGVRAQLQGYVSTDLVELGGVNRYDTADKIVRHAFGGSTPDHVILASGANFADALSSGGVAGVEDVPVVLVPGIAAEASEQTGNLLNDLDVTDAIVVGGQPSINFHYLYTLDGRVGWELTYERFWGPNRYGTSQNLNGAFFDSADTVYLATGTSFPDALAGAALAGAQDAPLYIVPQNCVPRRVLNDLARLQPDKVILLGGEPSLGATVRSLTPCP